MSVKATLRALQEIKDVDEPLARQVCEVWTKATREQLIERFPSVAAYDKQCHSKPPTIVLRRMAVDTLLGTYGVEFLGKSRQTSNDVYYCNTGETYDVTVLFNGTSMRVGSWGDLVEHNAIRDPNSTEF